MSSPTQKVKTNTNHESAVSIPNAPFYWCFISYRHADNKNQDRDWASWLHGEIERYDVPAELVGTMNKRGDTIPERIYPVFRDEESLPADADLGKSIVEAIDRSKFLIVLCSPRAVESTYVAEEVHHFKKGGKGDRMIAVILAGEPGNTERECFPFPVKHPLASDGTFDTTIEEEPIAADFRLRDGSEGYTSAEAYRLTLIKDPNVSRDQARCWADVYAGKLQLMKLKIIAGILGLPLETLRNRDQAYQLELARKKARRTRRLAVAFGIIGAFAICGGLIAWKQSNLAKEESARTRKTLSFSDLHRATELASAGENQQALSFLARSLRNDSMNHAAARRALMMLQEQPWFVPVVESDSTSMNAERLHSLIPGMSLEGPFTGIDSPKQIMDPVSGTQIDFKGFTNEFDRRGSISFPVSDLTYDIGSPCISASFFPTGSWFATEDMENIRIWGLDGKRAGRLGSVQSSGKEIRRPGGGIVVSVDGCSIFADAGRWNRIGRMPVTQFSSESVTRIDSLGYPNNLKKVTQRGISPFEVTGKEGGEWIDFIDPIAAIRFDHGIEIWNFTTREKVGEIGFKGDGNPEPFIPFNGTLRPGGKQLLVSLHRRKKSYEIFNTQTGKREGSGIPCFEVYSSANYSQGGSILGIESGSDSGGPASLQIWDADLRVPLSRIWNSGEVYPGSGVPWNFGHGGRFFLPVSLYEESGYAFYEFEFPTILEPVPIWLSDFLEAVAGWRFRDDVTLLPMEAAEIHQRISQTKAIVSAKPVSNGWAAIIGWWLDDSPAKTVSPSSPRTIKDYVVAREKSGKVPDLEVAIHADPKNAKLYQKLSEAYREEAIRSGNPYAQSAESKAVHFAELYRRLSAGKQVH